MPGMRIAIVDDHALVRAGLIRLLSGCGRSCPRPPGKARSSPSRSLPSRSRRAYDHPRARCRLLGDADSRPHDVRRAGVRRRCRRGLVSKSAPADALYAAIEAAAAGSLERPGAGLTARERDVLALLGEGRGDAEIALALGISPRTVVNHCARLREKLGLHTRAGLIAHAKRVGLAPRD